jgi:multidrug transporter EmrE-like cation transporter
MILFFGFLAAIGCAIFNGGAAILEKIGAGQEDRSSSIHLGLLWRLRGNVPYLFGIVLDLFAWVLTLLAVHTLPLFLVQPIIACSIIVTIMIERFLFNHHANFKFIFSLLVILAGITLLALVSTPEKAAVVSNAIRWSIISAPLILIAVGTLFSSVKKKFSTYALAAVSGLAFGGVSIAGRAIIFTHSYFHLLLNPLLWATIVYGLIGILFFTTALQKASATAVNATMIACETLLPISIGLLFLGDRPKNNLWIVVAMGVILTLVGTIFIAINSKESELYFPKIGRS